MTRTVQTQDLLEMKAMNRRSGARLIVLTGSLALLLGCAASGGGPPGDAERFERGKQAYLDERYSRAFELLLREAEDGNHEAQYTVGYMYYQGQGVSQNDQAALRWIQASAAGGHARAVEALGQLAGMGARQRITPEETEPEAGRDDDTTRASPTMQRGPMPEEIGSQITGSEVAESSADQPPPRQERPPAVEEEPPPAAETEVPETELTGTEVTAESSADEPHPRNEPPPAVDDEPGFALQLGSFRQQRNAMRERDRLRAADVDAFISETRDDQGPIYRLRVGPLKNRQEVETMRQRIADTTGTAGFMVPHP